MRSFLGACLALLALHGPAHAEKIPVGLLFVLEMDRSQSTANGTQNDYAFMRDGFTEALREFPLEYALAGAPHQSAAFLIIEWAAEKEQHVCVDWTLVRTREERLALADDVEKYCRGHGPGGNTSPGDAVLHAIDQIAQGPYAARQVFINLSTNGPKSDVMRFTPRMVAAREGAAALGYNVSVIALEILSITFEDERSYRDSLTGHYEEHLITGPRSFAFPILSSYARAPQLRVFFDAFMQKMEAEIAGGELPRREWAGL